MIIEQVAAHQPSQKINPNNPIQLNCPEHILNAFRHIIADSKLPGTTFDNPYTGDTETFPSNPDEFTAKHLQIIARNERVNTTGVMNTDLYDNHLTVDQIASVRCLVKATVIGGVTEANAQGGYRASKQEFENPQKIIVVDQAGLQWQGDFRNTGGLFFYPDDAVHKNLPEHYASWQNDMFHAMYGQDRPIEASKNRMNVTWKGVKGCLDLDKVAMAIESEFLQALDAAVSQGNVGLEANEQINFKFLKAGMGFFADGLRGCDKNKLEMARLQGIEKALVRIALLPEEEKQAALGKVKRLELPYSSSPPKTDEILGRIENLTKKLGLTWGGAAHVDALAPREGYVNATTNCADPHAMIGNEGGHHSVDAAISSNANLSSFNPAYNEGIQLRASPIFDNQTAISNVKLATEQYLAWMNDNAQGIRGITRFTHMFHGDSGMKRAQNILNMINNGDSYESINQAVTEAFAASGTSQHSYSRYLVENLTPGNRVLENETKDSDFSTLKENYNITEKFKNFKSQMTEFKKEGVNESNEKEVTNSSSLNYK